ncbi:hypothetical protein V8G54_037434 [Vigna mungo]|uniref:Uncharacterized protein n=1 Tax=Vigna mungo TaxID=3915 RepID=A0AAQ3MJC2_VIGMU
MDGTFLRFGELKGAGAMIQQVKGFSYSISSLLGASPFFPTTYGDVQEKHNESITTSEKSNKSRWRVLKYYCIVVFIYINEHFFVFFIIFLLFCIFFVYHRINIFVHNKINILYIFF